VRTLYRFTRIDREERRLFFTGMLLMGAVRMALYVWSLERVTAMLKTLNQRFPRPDDAPAVGLRRAARRLDQAGRFCPLPLTCLAKALAGRALMERYGHAGELRIGVRKSEGKFEAHAWLECENDVLIGNPMPHGKAYTQLEGI
jgi:Transglutaminase-like superfamily